MCCLAPSINLARMKPGTYIRMISVLTNLMALLCMASFYWTRIAGLALIASSITALSGTPLVALGYLGEEATTEVSEIALKVCPSSHSCCHMIQQKRDYLITLTAISKSNHRTRYDVVMKHAIHEDVVDIPQCSKHWLQQHGH